MIGISLGGDFYILYPDVCVEDLKTNLFEGPVYS